MTLSINKALALLIAALSLAYASAGVVRPDFSGTWTIDKSETRLQIIDIGNLDSATVVIAQSDTDLKFTRRFVVRGQGNTFTYQLPMNGRVDTSRGGAVAPRTTTTSGFSAALRPELAGRDRRAIASVLPGPPPVRPTSRSLIINGSRCRRAQCAFHPTGRRLIPGQCCSRSS